MPKGSRSEVGIEMFPDQQHFIPKVEWLLRIWQSDQKWESPQFEHTGKPVLKQMTLTYSTNDLLGGWENEKLLQITRPSNDVSKHYH